MGFGQIGIELDGLAGELVRLSKGSRTEKVAIQAIDPDGNVGIRQDGKGAGMAWINSKRLPQETPRLGRPPPTIC